MSSSQVQAKNPPPSWTEEELEAQRALAIAAFRDERMKEPLEKYLEEFERYQGAFEELLETTVDLTQLFDHAVSILKNDRLCEALRYLPGPPISLDDLKVVAEAPSLAPKKLDADPQIAKRIIETVFMGLDRARFVWVSEQREATEKERASAILASAAMIASRRVETLRRNQGKQDQEQRVADALIKAGFKQVETRTIGTLNEAPKPGEFCKESTLGTRKADLIAGLWDNRILAIECKVSNSATNSIKRLNNDAAVKAEVWRKDFGTLSVVPAAVLGGVYKLRNLVEAQTRGLTLFWAHDIDALTKWIEGTR